MDDIATGIDAVQVPPAIEEQHIYMLLQSTSYRETTDIDAAPVHQLKRNNIYRCCSSPTAIHRGTTDIDAAEVHQRCK
jgi:hypothetical protein